MSNTLDNRQPAAVQPMPPLTPEQHDALRADIAENGVRVPIVVDQHGRIIDGNNRAAIAAELGIDCPREVVEVADDDTAVDLALTLNCARRHLTREQRRDLIAAELARRPDDSDRAIARRVGCSPSTVGSVRREVSNLDTPTTSPMTREEAEESTRRAREALASFGRNVLDYVFALRRSGESYAGLIVCVERLRADLRDQTRSLSGSDEELFDIVWPIFDGVFDEAVGIILEAEAATP